MRRTLIASRSTQWAEIACGVVLAALSGVFVSQSALAQRGAEPPTPVSDELKSAELGRAEALTREAFDAIRSGKAHEALPKAQESLAIREKALGPGHPSLAASLNNVAELYRAVGAYEKSLPLYQRSLSIYEMALGPEHPSVATSLNNLALLYRDMGDYELALPLYQRSLAIREKALGAGHPEVATGLNNLAGLYRAMGAYDKALLLYQRSLPIHEKALGPDHPNVATSLNNLALLYRDMGAYGKALPLYQRSLAIREHALGAEHPNVAASLNNLAGLYRAMSDYGKAQVLYQRSLTIYEKALGPAHPNVAMSLNNLAGSYRDAGAYDQALPFYQRSLAVGEQALGPAHPHVAASLNNLAALHQDMGAFDKALPLYERSLRIKIRQGNAESLAHTQYSLGSLHARQQRRPLAIFLGKQAVNNLQRVRAGLAGVDRELQDSFLKSKEIYYQDLAGWLVGEGRLPEAQQVLAMLKEQELYELLRSGGAEDVRKTQATYTGQESQWAADLGRLQGQLGAVAAELDALEKKAQLGLSNQEKARRAELEQQRDAGQQAFDRFIATLMQEVGRTASAERNQDIARRNLPDLFALQGTLAELGHGAVTVHYLALEDKTHIILTTPQVQIARESPVKAAELNRLIQLYREVLQDPRRNPLPLAQTLYKHLIAPVAADLEQAKAQTLMVSLDGALRYLPLAALNDGKQYLAERFAIAIYTEAAKDRLKDKPTSQWQLAGLGLTRQIEGFSALPSVRAEIEGILKGGILPGQAYFDDQFNAERFRTTLDERRAVLHVASHFVFTPGTEFDSFLVLGDGTRLSLADMKRLRFRDMDLFTLSACETAVGGGKDANGREIEGFGALAQRQGAKGVLATLWPVADASTGLFMQAFYRLRETNAGMTKAEALRQVQFQFIKGKPQTAGGSARSMDRLDTTGTPSATQAPEDYRHPFYWAPFILMGNWL